MCLHVWHNSVWFAHTHILTFCSSLFSSAVAPPYQVPAFLLQSSARKERAENKQNTGEPPVTCSGQWQGFQKWLMRTTGPGQTLGLHSKGPVPGGKAESQGRKKGGEKTHPSRWVWLTSGCQYVGGGVSHGAIVMRDCLCSRGFNTAQVTIHRFSVEGIH